MMSKLVAVSAEEYAERRLNPMWKDAVFPFSVGVQKGFARRLRFSLRYGEVRRLRSQGRGRVGCKDNLCYPCDLGRRRLQVADKMGVPDLIYGELHEPVACSGITFTSPSDTWKLVREKTAESGIGLSGKSSR